MKRRTLLKQLGTASVATTALVGSANARPVIDRELDVSGVSDQVPLRDLLTQEEIAQFGDELGPMQITVSPDADTINPNYCCPTYTLCEELETCHCNCCTCLIEEEPPDK